MRRRRSSKTLMCVLTQVAIAIAGLLHGSLALPDGQPTSAQVQTRAPRSEPPVARLIIGLRAPQSAGLAAVEPGKRARAVAGRSGLTLRGERELTARLRVLELDAPVAGAALEQTLARLAADPAVAFVEPDARMFRHAVASDAMFAQQWQLLAEQPAALDVASAWDVTAGSAATVIAVVDTGVRFEHPDLGRAGQGGRLLPGRDFVGADPDGRFRLANDGNGWDADASDPGDWISVADTQLPVFADCEVQDSSWHGTRVAGIIGAITNNGVGVAGTSWTSWILPVRVLGKCAGYRSDILQGMRWAAGLTVPGVPNNPYPAQIINLSLGGVGSCPASYRTVIDELLARGVLVVASAGNSIGGPVDYPANCPGVLAVAGLRHAGTKVGFSSIGPQVGVSAPGGNCVNTTPGSPCLFSLHTTFNTGRTTPMASSYTGQFEINVGTSFAAPSVAAIAALMHAVNGNLGPEALIARISEGARPFPAAPDVPQCHVPVSDLDTQLECACTTATCGAGMAHAPGSVNAALRPIAAVAVPAVVSSGQNVPLDASGSAAACGRSIAAFQWTTISGESFLSATEGAVVTVIAPPPGGTVRVSLTVTDDQGGQDSAEVVVLAGTTFSDAPASAGTRACPVPIDPGVAGVPPGSPPPSGGGGGGGSLGLGWPLLLIAGWLTRRRQRS